MWCCFCVCRPDRQTNTHQLAGVRQNLCGACTCLHVCLCTPRHVDDWPAGISCGTRSWSRQPPCRRSSNPCHVALETEGSSHFIQPLVFVCLFVSDNNAPCASVPCRSRPHTCAQTELLPRCLFLALYCLVAVVLPVLREFVLLVAAQDCVELSVCKSACCERVLRDCAAWADISLCGCCCFVLGVVLLFIVLCMYIQTSGNCV